MDFTESTSPQMSTPDFFDKVHRMHERKESICDSPFPENAENADPQHSLANDKMYLKIQEENIIKNTPIKVIISPPCRGKEAVEQFTTCDKVLSDAMRKLDFCKRLPKMQDLSKIVQEPMGFKTPNTTKLVKLSRSVGCHSLPHKGIMMRRQESRSAKKINKNPVTSSSAVRKQSVSLSLFKEGNRTQNAAVSDELYDSLNDKRNEIKCDIKETCDVKNSQDEEEEENKKHNVNKTEETNEMHNITEGEIDEESDFKDKSEESADDKQQQDEDSLQQPASSKSTQPPKVLTWKNHRRITMDGRRMSVSKKYVSMAEAVSRFQNATPKRFHTKSTKDNVVSNVVSRQTHLKTTIPISPALVTKNRTRPVKVLSREEKEILELEEMKKHRIKANPIPRGVLARRTNVAIKSTSLNTQPAEILRSRSPLHKSDVTTATTVVRIDADGIVAKREDISSFGVPSMTKSVTRVKPFSLETRSKDLQKKKEERLRNLQEAAAKPPKEFHARPAPNFSKPPTPAGTSQAGRKHPIVPRPFSFDERDKLIPKKKEQKIKELLEEEKRSRVFRANPVPVFKPVLQQEDAKATTAKAASLHEDKCEDQKERPAAKNTTKNVADCSDKQKKAPLTNRTSLFELYTDKRARERREFEEKLRRKEMEEEAMRQEQQKRQEEHDRRMRAEMRKLAEVKAKPMPTFKTPVIARHTKPLTNPQSPAFASKRPKQQ